MATTKIDKDFVLSDSSVNVYGFRLLTEGYMMDEFLKNPIGYYNHDKADGVLLKWEDVRVEGDNVIGKPVINMEHPRAERTIKEVADGFLNAASMGKLTILQARLEDNPNDPDDPILVAEKWFNKECSFVENPGNRNAMKVELYDLADQCVDLSDFKTNIKKANMKKVTLEVTTKLLEVLNLSDDNATGDAIVAGVVKLHDENEQLTQKLQKAETDLADNKKAADEAAVNTALDKAVTEGKINVPTRNKMAVAFAGRPKDLSDLLDTMPAYQSIVDKIDKNKGAGAKNVTDLADKTWEELDLNDQLETLKANDFDAFKAKFKAKFGKEYAA